MYRIEEMVVLIWELGLKFDTQALFSSNSLQILNNALPTYPSIPRSFRQKTEEKRNVRNFYKKSACFSNKLIVTWNNLY